MKENVLIKENILAELKKKPITQLDIYYLSEEIDRLKTEIGTLQNLVEANGDILNTHLGGTESRWQRMRDAFKIEVKNGTTRVTDIGQLTLENYNDLRPLRDFNKIYDIIMRHKMLFIIVSFFIFVYQGEIANLIGTLIAKLNLLELIVK